MKRFFFEAQMSKLAEVYGPKNYSGVRLDNFWDRYGKISAEEFETAINNLLNSSRFAPLATELDAELHGPLQVVKENRVNDLVSKFPCITCKSTGRVTQKINPKEAAYSFRCHCQLGKMLFPNFPVYRNLKMTEPAKPGKPHPVNNMEFDGLDF